MKLNFSYGTGVLVLPQSVLSHMPPDSAYLYVLLMLSSTPVLRDTGDYTVEALAGASKLPADTVRNALSYWCAEGILVPAEEETADMPPRIRPASEEKQTAAALKNAEQQTQEAKTQPVKAQSALPDYTQEQTAQLILSDPGLKSTLDACQQALGKILTEKETEQLAALYDSYGLDGEYLLTLLALCRKRGKLSVSYAVRTALGLYDEGVRTAAELGAKIAYLDRLSDASYRIRTMFGIGERAFTAAENTYIETWTEVWKMPMDVIRCAYELTIRAIEKPRMSYVNKILSRWNDLGIRTVEAVRAAEEQYAASRASATPEKPEPQKKKTGKADDNAFSTFDADEFLALAMKRTFPET